MIFNISISSSYSRGCICSSSFTPSTALQSQLIYAWVSPRDILFSLSLPATSPSQTSIITAAAAESHQSCPTLCNPIDGSPSGFPVPGILQARTLEWVAISFSNAWKWKVKVKSFSRVRPSATPWTAALQALPSMGFSRQEYWSGVPLPSPTNECASLHKANQCICGLRLM